MDLGVWMSRGVLAHKRETDHDLQAWNLKELPDEFSHSPEPHRLYIAVDGYWRGFFILKPWVNRNSIDKRKPWTIVFDPKTWTEVPRESAPRKDTTIGYTLEVPKARLKRGTK